MRVLVSGGGSAGHINPALSIADKIKKENPDAVIEYVGTPKGMENNLVPKAGYKIHHVKVRGFVRKLTFKNFDAAVKAVTSVMEAKKIVKSFKPDIVIGTGGYVSWPVLKAASKLGVPTCIHEQNAFPGVTTRMLSKYVDKVMISFEESAKYFDNQEKLTLVGNPVSEKMLNADKALCREKLGLSENARVILSCGGSLGARPLNENVYELIKNYSLVKENVYHFHAVGNAGWPVQSALYKELGFEETAPDTLKKGNVVVSRYIYNMHELLPASDVLVCRAGAMTLSEMACLKKASVIIPSPYVTNNHQYKNAKVLSDKGAGVLIEEKDLNGDILISAVNELVCDDKKRSEMEKAVGSFAVYDTLDRIYSIVKELIAR